MAWIGSLHENFCLVDAPMLEEEKIQELNCIAYDHSLPVNQSHYSPAFEGSYESLETLLGSSLSPLRSVTNITNGVMTDLTTFGDPEIPDCSSLRFECLEPSPSINDDDFNLLRGLGREEAKRESDGFSEENCGNDRNDKHKSHLGKLSKNKDGCVGTRVGNIKRKKNSNGLPAKNLMAERRRRKRLNDRLHMLRSVVPKISKTDRISIVGDAVEYMKELLQQINECHNENMQYSETPCVPDNSSKFHLMTDIEPAFLCPDMEEYHLVVPNPDAHPPKSIVLDAPPPTGSTGRTDVEVRTISEKAWNIHISCSKKVGLLLSTVRALDALGLDIRQAVVSCFDGFKLDVSQAEQCVDKNIPAQTIKALLLRATTGQTTA